MRSKQVSDFRDERLERKAINPYFSISFSAYSPSTTRTYLQEKLLLREIGDFGPLAWNLGKSGTLAMEMGEFEAAYTAGQKMTMAEAIRCGLKSCS